MALVGMDSTSVGGLGMPVVVLATTELPSVIVNGVNGHADTRPDRLVEVMHELLRDPALARRGAAHGAGALVFRSS
jgi:hypothetical protein